jgi:hypothetical protein
VIEQRLTALIQTRLTILQARLSLHSAAASLANSPQPPTLATLPTPDQSHATLSPPAILSKERATSPSTYRQSPILNAAKPSPTAPPTHAVNRLPPMTHAGSSQRLPPIQTVEGYAHAHAQPQSRMRGASAEKSTKAGCCPSRGKQEGSTSPRSVSSERSGSGSSRNGLEMLLDAGIETERRASGGKERE